MLTRSIVSKSSIFGWFDGLAMFLWRTAMDIGDGNFGVQNMIRRFNGQSRQIYSFQTEKATRRVASGRVGLFIELSAEIHRCIDSDLEGNMIFHMPARPRGRLSDFLHRRWRNDIEVMDNIVVHQECYSKKVLPHRLLDIPPWTWKRYLMMALERCRCPKSERECYVALERLSIFVIPTFRPCLRHWLVEMW